MPLPHDQGILQNIYPWNIKITKKRNVWHKESISSFSFNQ